MAFGQANNVILEQSGDGSTANLGQTFVGPGGPNRALVTQDGARNRIDEFAQYGSENLLNINQQGRENLVQEHADQGRSGTRSVNGDIDIDQIGTGNEVWDADQAGSGNELTIEQRNGGESAPGNFADVDFQWALPGGAEGNDATIMQTGINNRVGTEDGASGLLQVGAGNEATLTQDGNHNRIGTRPVSAMPTGGVRTIPPRHDPAAQQAVVQRGTKNTATIEQDGADVIRSVLQKGTKNELAVTQGGSQGASNAVGATQRGRENTVSVDQFGKGDSAEIFQQGDRNSVTADQHGASRANLAYVTQSGADNTATIMQR
jgi:hypothetical protein